MERCFFEVVPNRMKILIVEDDTLFGELVLRKIELIRDKFPMAEITLVATMKAATRIVSEDPAPDVTFLDLSLPDSDFEQTIASIPMLDERTSIVVVTGHPEARVRQRIENQSIPIVLKDGELLKGDSILRILIGAFMRNRRADRDIESNLQKLRELVASHAP